MRRAIAPALILALAISACGKPTSKDLIQKSQERLQSGDLPGALELISKAMEAESGPEGDPILYGDAAMASATYHIYNREISAARKDWEDVYKRFGMSHPEPKLAEHSKTAAINIIRSWIEEKKPENALAMVEETSPTLMRDSTSALGFLGTAADTFVALNRTEDALHHLQALADRSTDPDSSFFALHQIAQLLVKEKGLDAAAEAYIDFGNKRRTEPAMEAYAAKFAGMVFQDAGTSPSLVQKRDAYLSDAYDKFDQIYRKTPDPTQQGVVTLELAQIAHVMGNEKLSEDRLTSITKTMTISPQVRYWAQKGLAEMRNSAGDLEGARKILQQAQQEFGMESEMGNEATQILADLNRRIAGKDILGGEGDSRPASGPASAPAQSKPSTDTAAPATSG